MQTLTFECDVGAERNLVLRLHATVTPGRHRIAVVIDPLEPAGAESDLIPVGDSVPPRTALWARLSALRDQAAREGELPEPMSWDEILTELQHRRGEQDALHLAAAAQAGIDELVTLERPEKPMCQQTEVHVVSLRAKREQQSGTPEP